MGFRFLLGEFDILWDECDQARDCLLSALQLPTEWRAPEAPPCAHFIMGRCLDTVICDLERSDWLLKLPAPAFLLFVLAWTGARCLRCSTLRLW